MSEFLSIIWYKVLPAKYGGQKGIARFNHYLGKKVNLTAICSADNHTADPLSYSILPQLPVSKIQFFNPGVRKMIKDNLAKHPYTHVILEHPYHAWLGKYKSKFNFRLIVHAHNIEYHRMQQRKKWWWPWVKYTEGKAFSYADFILFKTENDKLLAQQIFKVPERKCVSVPYGIEVKESPEAASVIRIKELIRAKHQILPGEKILLFAGTPDYEPNLIALENIISKVLPALRLRAAFRFKILICGHQQPATIEKFKSEKEMIFTGFVDSIDEYMQAADVFINPVLLGSGIQTKNIDAIANGLSVAATKFAATGLPAYLTGNKLMVSNNEDWDQFAQNIIQLCQNPYPTPLQFYTDFYWGNIIDRTLSIVL